MSVECNFLNSEHLYCNITTLSFTSAHVVEVSEGRLDDAALEALRRNLREARRRSRVSGREPAAGGRLQARGAGTADERQLYAPWCPGCG